MAREGELSLNYRDNDQYRYYSASVQLFPWLETTLRYTDVRTRQYSSVEAFLAIKRIKIKPSISNCVCGKRVTGCRKWRLVRGISAVRGCLMRNILLPAKHGGRSILRSALGWGYLGTSGNVKIRSVQPVINIAIAITATNRRDLSTVARCSTVLPHCLAAWNTRRPATAAPETGV